MEKVMDMTRYWPTPEQEAEQEAERERLNRKRLRFYDSTNDTQPNRRLSYELLCRMGR